MRTIAPTKERVGRPTEKKKKKISSVGSALRQAEAIQRSPSAKRLSARYRRRRRAVPLFARVHTSPVLKNDGLGRELSRRVCSTTPLQVRLRARSGARAQMAMRTVALTKEVVAVRRSSEQGTQAKKVAERFLQQFSARKGPKGAQDLDALNEEYISKVA